MKRGPCTCRAKRYLSIYLTLWCMHIPRTDQVHVPSYSYRYRGTCTYIECSICTVRQLKWLEMTGTYCMYPDLVSTLPFYSIQFLHVVSKVLNDIEWPFNDPPHPYPHPQQCFLYGKYISRYVHILLVKFIIHLEKSLHNWRQLLWTQEEPEQNLKWSLK